MGYVAAGGGDQSQSSCRIIIAGAAAAGVPKGNFMAVRVDSAVESLPGFPGFQCCRWERPCNSPTPQAR